MLAVGGQDRGDDLGLVVVAVREQRADRTIDEAGNQDLAVREASLALEEATGDLARGRSLLDEVDGQGEEVDARTGLRVACGHEDLGLTPRDDDAAGLLGHLAGLEGKGVFADLDGRRLRFEPIRHGCSPSPADPTRYAPGVGCVVDGVDRAIGALRNAGSAMREAGGGKASRMADSHIPSSMNNLEFESPATPKGLELPRSLHRECRGARHAR